MMPSHELRDVHRRCSWHRMELIASEVCGCFYCLRMFKPAAITQWTDKHQDEGQTALCPYCGIDSVLGSASVATLTEDLLIKMRTAYFGKPDSSR